MLYPETNQISSSSHVFFNIKIEKIVGGNFPHFRCLACCVVEFITTVRLITGSPSSKYEHRRASALLRNIQNIRICMGKKPIVSVPYENERISIKRKTAYLT